ncbi:MULTISPECIES: fimbrial protein [Serratia]|uniref:fimbrial protein n=1 Tax=Serratia TaxID=613 RepID=UPI0007C754B1|nr:MULTISPECIES: fimbrial protein [Serratia]AOF00620.1 fimbria A protein [Serratia surfactantfaciens]MEB5613799.1 fimbrial protein [Serratia marcescens]BEM88677.1 fimbrial A protein [Serratia marcescens]
MKLNNIMMAAALAFGLSSTAFAADQGHGKVTFTGAIIDAPCSINPESIDQTVELGQISKVALLNGGKSTPRNFAIDLENCTFENDAVTGNPLKNKVTLTFTGMESKANNGLLGITGTAQGASVAITDGSGQVIKLGKATKAQELQNGSNSLNFAAYLQGDVASGAVLTEGEFQSVADFTLAYN